MLAFHCGNWCPDPAIQRDQTGTMGERRKWDKMHHDAMVLPTTTVAAATGAGDVDPVREKQMQYIKMLEERNRLKKKLAQTSKKDQQEKRREEAFTTTFNVAPSSSTSTGGPQETVRKNKSSAALLPTRLGTSDQTRGRSAPSATLPLRYTPRGDNDDVAQEKASNPPARRAKWKKPAAGEVFGIDNRSGKARLCVESNADDKEEESVAAGGARDDNIAKNGDDDNEEGVYLEESFEEFEEDDVKDCIDEEEEQDEQKTTEDRSFTVVGREEKAQQRTPVALRAESKHASPVGTADASSSSGLSGTTTELFSVVQNLSRSKQRALVDLLQKFDASDQRASDVKQLQMSIGDPRVWKQISAVLLNDKGSPKKDEKQQGLTLAQVMEEQQRWEEEYARQVQEKLAKEREAKEKALRDAEERRIAMLRQLEEEERELERLMEQKRRERLAKLKLLDEEASPKNEMLPVAKPSPSTSPRKKSKKPAVSDGSGSVMSNRVAVEDKPSEPKPVIQTLDISTLPMTSSVLSSQQTAHGVEIRVRLLSTWGNTRAIGLSQICVYDADGSELPVDVQTVNIYERRDGRPLPRSNEMSRTILRLFSGVPSTTSDHDMWLGRLSDTGMLEIGFFVDSTPNKLCVWNFNSKMCSACTRDVEVFINGKCMWSGSLPQGFGNEDDNVCTWINVLPSGKKTARAATARESSRPPPLRVSAIKDETPNAISSSSGPIWLSAGASGSGSLSARAESKASLPLDLEDEKQHASTSGNLTSRRHRGSSNDAFLPARQEKLSESKLWSNSSTSSGRESKAMGGVAATLSPSWDSLEHFSKTSRSRLPSATEGSDETSSLPSNPLVDRATPAKQFLPTTTSALLQELRGITTTQATAIPTTHVPVVSSVKIPELPSGSRLKIEIVSTWGDQFYVGLNGIEIFDHRGKLITFDDPEQQVVAQPPSINVLDEYNDDPRVAKNLVDGVSDTCDDFHMWLAPYTAGVDHHITLDFGKSTSLSMVRVWNYNKSRAHTFRGVREVRLVLFSSPKSDAGIVIFEGEVERAPGTLWRDTDHDNRSTWAEVILFTTDQSILTKIEANDALLLAYGKEEADDEATTAIAVNVRTSLEMHRPRTSDNGESASKAMLNNDDRGHEERSGSVPTKRPTTSVKRPQPSHELRKSIDSWVSEEPQQLSPVLSKVVERDAEEDDDSDIHDDLAGLPRGRRVVVHLLNTWGDKNYIGMTQLDILVGVHGTPIPLDSSCIDASPRDLATLGYHGDPRTLDKLINGVGTTCDDTNMWLIPFSSQQEVRIDLKQDQYIYGLRIWNYNKSPEDSFRGVKQITVALDGKLISPKQTGFVLRKAPGSAFFDFDQIIRFHSGGDGDKRTQTYTEKVAYPLQSKTYKTPTVKQDYEPPLYPQGFLLKFVFWTTWGDPYYLGLNGIELYDFHGKRVSANPTVVMAKPHSLCDLQDSSDDVRVPANLLSGKDKNTWDASDAWLAPLASSLGSNQGNVLYIGFDTPIVLSLIKFWNYSKTPERGVKDMDAYLDDLQIFSGTLKKAPHGNAAQNVGRFGNKAVVVEEFAQPLLFSTNQALVDQEKRRIYYCGSEEQDVLCINEGQVVQESKAMYRKPDPGAEGVVVDLGLRPVTAMCRK